ncbi:MAG: type VI secretion system contractile sheath large subunit [Mariniblastus sp.]|nr:type VI secretion system contractile sheath large subunit [Mariniblastus sp.]
MSSAEQENQQSTTQEESVSLLEQCITNTKKTERDYAQEMIQSLTEQALQGTVKFSKSTNHTIKSMISAIDQTVSTQLSKVMHHEKFQKLEGSWRGVQHLVSRSLTGPDLKIKLLDIRKKELYKDVEADIESSCMWQKLYSEDFDRLGGEPYGAVVGDYAFGNNPEDIKLLEQMSHISAAGFCPFLSTPSPDLLQLDSWDELARVDRKGNLMDIFDGVEYAQWRGFRDSEDSRYVCLTMPRTLARLPYGVGGKSVDERIMDFQELPLGKDGKPSTAGQDQFCWMSTAFVMAERLANSYSQTGFCTAIRGVQNGGKVEGLPAYTFKNEDGALDLQCPTEIGIGDRLEAELGKCGLLPLVHHKNADHAVFIGGESAQKAKTYQGKGGKDASENAQISARLPYVMASSRFAHYLKSIARDWIGSFKEEGDLQASLEDWIGNYVSDSAKGDDRARFPLKAAKIEVKPVAGKSGAYNAVAYLQPWLQMEELTTSLRMVARIPTTGG